MFKHKLSANKQQNLPNSQLSFNIPHSKYQSKLYKIFYFNENRNEWIFDKNSFEQFSNDKKITVEFANTPLVCFIDSNEKDLISINSHFINGNYPNLNEIQEENKESSQKLEQYKSKIEKKQLKINEKEEINSEVPENEIEHASNEIFVYALCDKPLSMLNYEVDFNDKRKSSIKPIFLLLHVPKEKEKHPNIKTIIIQIYTFLSLICDIRIAVLDKYFYEIQVQNALQILKLIDENIKKLIENKKIDENDEESEIASCEIKHIDGKIDEDIDFEMNYATNIANKSNHALFYYKKT